VVIKIISIVGARPNFMKIAPFIKAIEKYNNYYGKTFKHILVHTGQHYDIRMSATFFNDLGIPDPDMNLEIGSGSHSEQVGKTMIALEKVLLEKKPDWVVVVGDVNATLAGSVTAKKLGIKVCHIEAGLRSRDMSMPEEINRLVTDRLSDLLFTPDRISSENLIQEGVPAEKIAFVGNVMIDTLEDNRNKAEKISIDNIIRSNVDKDAFWDEKIVQEGKYALITLHRPSNVDDKIIFESIISFLSDEVSVNHALIWPIQPRSKKNLVKFELWEKVVKNPQIILLEPLRYHEMLRLNMGAAIMFTDSGGLQEECCVLGTPCLTLRWNTERPVTLLEHGGASILVGNDIEKIRKEYYSIISQKISPKSPELWDGNTSERILEVLLKFSARN